MIEFALLITALLFGGISLYSFGFAAFVFNALPADTAGPLIRRAFPLFYLFVLGTSALAASISAFADQTVALILGAIAVTTLVARQVIMPAVDAATDAGASGRFKALHSLSVVITLAHIVGAGFAIVMLAAKV